MSFRSNGFNAAFIDRVLCASAFISNLPHRKLLIGSYKIQFYRLAMTCQNIHSAFALRLIRYTLTERMRLRLHILFLASKWHPHKLNINICLTFSTKLFFYRISSVNMLFVDHFFSFCFHWLCNTVYVAISSLWLDWECTYIEILHRKSPNFSSNREWWFYFPGKCGLDLVTKYILSMLYSCSLF